MGYALKNVNSIESMLRYCNDSLKWNIDEEYFDDIDELTYDFTASDLGIKDEEFAKINTLKQMRPLSDNQDWAVFLVDFEGKRIDVTALRRVLNAIIPKRTNRDRMTWACDHIFFMCLWGEYSVRSIGFSAFEEYEKSLPVMKIVYCTPAIESTEGIRKFENQIAFLECDRNENFIDRLKFWSQALRRRYQNPGKITFGGCAPLTMRRILAGTVYSGTLPNQMNVTSGSWEATSMKSKIPLRSNGRPTQMTLFLPSRWKCARYAAIFRSSRAKRARSTPLLIASIGMVIPYPSSRRLE